MGDNAARPSIVIIGAGATGRGHIGQIAHDAGWAITLIDRNRDLVECLRTANRYTVRLAGEKIHEIEITGFTVLHVDDRKACANAVAQADIVATAVLPTNLESTVPTFVDGLTLRHKKAVAEPLNVIACENMEHSSSTLRSYLRQSAPDLDWDVVDGHTGFPDSMVARAVPVPKEPLLLLAESNQEWSVDASAILEPMPRIEGMTLSTDQNAALERKLYIKNTGHFAIGMLGYLKGYELMDEAARDPEIFRRVDAATRESAAAVTTRHGFPSAEIEEYRTSFLEQMKSPFLPDDVKRVIREPIRKLAREERLIGPAMLAWEQGRSPAALAYVIAATFRHVNPEDPQSRELESRLASDGLESVLKQVCGIPEGHDLIELISRAYHASPA